MSEKAISMNRLRNMFLNVIEATISLRSEMEDVKNEITQEKIDSITNMLGLLDYENQALKNCIVTVLKESAGQEVDEIDVKPGKNGNEIL
jgi:hypothetical protein